MTWTLFQHLVTTQDAGWNGENITASGSSQSLQQVLAQRWGKEENLVPGVSLSLPAEVNGSGEMEVTAWMNPGDSLILTQQHCYRDCSLYWYELIPGTTAPGPAENRKKMFIYQQLYSPSLKQQHPLLDKILLWTWRPGDQIFYHLIHLQLKQNNSRAQTIVWITKVNYYKPISYKFVNSVIERISSKCLKLNIIL